MKRVRVCPHVTRDGKSCPELQPCPTHSRPANASWSPQRDRKAHFKLRMAVIKARGPRCERCGWPSPDGRGKDLQLHHVRPGNTPSAVILLCRDCHRKVDVHAR